MLIIDGHGSCFEGAKLMKYALDNEHRWEIHIGVPYCTGLWQFGDVIEQNGCFNVECYREKDVLFKLKRSKGLPAILSKTDIIPFTKCGWMKSFAIVSSNIKAIQERGWGH